MKCGGVLPYVRLSENQVDASIGREMRVGGDGVNPVSDLRAGSGGGDNLNAATLGKRCETVSAQPVRGSLGIGRVHHRTEVCASDLAGVGRNLVGNRKAQQAA